VVGKRALLRKLDLPKVVRLLGTLLEALSGTAPRIRGIVGVVQHAFEEVLQAQISEGEKSTQGIAGNYFLEFLLKVARGLDLAPRSLLFGLLEQDKDEVERAWNRPFMSDVEVFADRGKSKDQNRRVSKQHTSMANSCQKCGSKFLTAANFCHDCGAEQMLHERGIPSTFKMFRGTQALFKESGMPETEFEGMTLVANNFSLPISEIWKHKQDFEALDVDLNGSVSLEEFAKGVRDRCNIPYDKPIPKELLDMNWFDTQGNINFEKYLGWALRVENTEHMLVTDPEERLLRRLSRDHKLSPPEVDRAKRVFDDSCLDGESVLREPGFRALMAKLLQADEKDIPNDTFRRCWTELVRGNPAHGIEFGTFLGWYVKSADFTES
jgi:hypothetical protein